MSVYHDEVEIEDFEFDEDEETYYYPCPCGDRSVHHVSVPVSGVIALASAATGLYIMSPCLCRE